MLIYIFLLSQKNFFSQPFLLLAFLFLKNGPSPASFSFIFGLFQTNNTIFTTNQCEKCQVHPVSSARIRTHDLWNMSRLP